MTAETSLTYKDAGVDIDAGDALVEHIKPLARATHRPGVLGGIGGFGGLFEIDLARWPHPVLVSGTDGVGTKLKLAIELDRYDTIGIDLVAMCANDVIVQGAEPLFFLDYYASGKLSVETAAAVIRGIATGCQQAGAALLGGETAELPGMYSGKDFDLAGFCVGIVNRDQIIDGTGILPGDVILGLASSGPHSNGYSLIRRVLEVSQKPLDSAWEGGTLGTALLAPTRIYVRSLLALMTSLPDPGPRPHHRRRAAGQRGARASTDSQCGAAQERLAAPCSLRLAANRGQGSGRRPAADLQLRHRHDGDRPAGRRRSRAGAAGAGR